LHTLNVLTNKFAFHVIDPDFSRFDYKDVLVPNMGIWASFKEMITGVETIYRKLRNQRLRNRLGSI